MRIFGQPLCLCVRMSKRWQMHEDFSSESIVSFGAVFFQVQNSNGFISLFQTEAFDLLDKHTVTETHTHILMVVVCVWFFVSHRNRQFDVFPRKQDLNLELSDTELVVLSQDHNIHINLSSSSHKMWLNLSLIHLCSVKPFSQIKRVLWISVV